MSKKEILGTFFMFDYFPFFFPSFLVNYGNVWQKTQQMNFKNKQTKQNILKKSFFAMVP